MMTKKLSSLVSILLLVISVLLVAIQCVGGKVINVTSVNITNITIEVGEDLETKIGGFEDGTEYYDEEDDQGDVDLEEVKSMMPIVEYGKCERGAWSSVADEGVENEPVGPLILNGMEDDVKFSGDASTNSQENGNEQKRGPCENVDVRICLLNECDWIDGKCVEKQEDLQAPGGIFPLSLPETYGEVFRLFRIMWENPPARGDPYIWMAFLIGTLTLAVIGLLWILLGWWIFKCTKRLPCCRCKKENDVPKKNDRRSRRRLARTLPLMILPDGRKVPVKVINVPKPRRKRMEPHELLSKFDAVSAKSPLRRENWPAYVGRTKEELERPSSWPYEGDGHSVGTPSPAATISHSPKKYHSYNYENPAFGMDMEESEVDPVDSKNEAFEDCLRDTSENLDESFDTNGRHQSTLVTFIDEIENGSGAGKDNSLDETISNGVTLVAAEKSQTEANTMVITTDEIESKPKKLTVMPIKEPESGTNSALETLQAMEYTVDEKAEIPEIQSEPALTEMSVTSNNKIQPKKSADISAEKVSELDKLQLQTEETNPPQFPSSLLQENDESKINEWEGATKL